MESFVADLKKELQCSLCKDTFTEPKILSCFHTFCKPCIKRHAEHVDQINIFKCPKCKAQISLPELSSAENLQPSLLHSRILKGLALVEGEKVCSASESHSSACWYCFDCDHSLCQECETSHTFFIKDHKVVRLADLKKEDIQFIITRENPCTSHPHHRQELLCEDCDATICKLCLIDHRNHKTMTLDKFASIKKAVLSKHLQILEPLRLDDKEKQQQEKNANTIIQQGEKAKKEVKDKTKKIIEKLQENERELLRQIDVKLVTATTNLNIIYHIPAVKEYIKHDDLNVYNNDVIHVFEKKGNVPTRISTIGSKGTADGQLDGPLGLAIDNDHHLLVCDEGNKSVQKFTLDGRFVGRTCDVINNPRYITVLKDGQLLVSTGSSGVWCVK